MDVKVDYVYEHLDYAYVRFNGLYYKVNMRDIIRKVDEMNRVYYCINVAYLVNGTPELSYG